MSNDIHEIFAIRYGHHPRRSSENFIGGDAHDVLQPLDYFVYAIVGEHRTIIVDTGFDETVGARRKRQTTKPVREGLAAIGIDPGSIGNVIISHMHYDHCGNHDCFRMRAITFRTAKSNTAPDAACATANCEIPTRKITSSRWCARCSPAA